MRDFSLKFNPFTGVLQWVANLKKINSSISRLWAAIAGVLAFAAGAGYIAIFGATTGDVTLLSSTEGTVSTPASIEIQVNSTPTKNTAMRVGTCLIEFSDESYIVDEYDCDDDFALIGTNSLTVNQVADKIDLLTNVEDIILGALTTSAGQANTTVFTADEVGIGEIYFKETALIEKAEYRFENVIRVRNVGSTPIQDAIDAITCGSAQQLLILDAGTFTESTVTLDNSKDCVHIAANGTRSTIFAGELVVNFSDPETQFITVSHMFLTGLDINFSNSGYVKFIRFEDVEFGSSLPISITGTDENFHLIGVKNSQSNNTYANVVMEDIFLSSESSTWNGLTLSGNMVAQHSSGELNGRYSMNDSIQFYPRNDGVHAFPLQVSVEFEFNDPTVTLNLDTNTYATATFINNTGVDIESMLEVLQGTNAGVVSPKPVITDNLDGTIDIGAGQVFIYDNDHQFGLPRRFSVPAQSGVSLTDNVTNYILVNFNAGSPQYVVSVTNTSNESDIIPVANYFRDGTELHEFDWDSIGEGLSNKIHQRILRTDQFAREDGLGLGEDTGRIVTIESGSGFNGAVPIDFDAFRSDTGEWYFYYWNGSAWIKDTGTTQYNNTQYQGPTGLVAAVPNKYLVNFVFRGMEQEDHGYYVLGTQEYPQTAAGLIAAQEAQIPASLPEIIREHAFFVGKIIVVTSASTATSIQSAFEQQFTITPATDHGSLSGLSDDDHLQYAFLAGRSGGQQLYGGTLTTNTLQLTDNSVDNNTVTIGSTIGLGSLDLSSQGSGHDGFTDFVSNEHVDHSTVQIGTAAGTSGLTGGGDITATRNLSVDIAGTTSESTNDDADLLLIYDDTATALKSMSRSDFLFGVSGIFELDETQTPNTVRENTDGAGDWATDDYVFGSPQLDYDSDATHNNRIIFDKSKGYFAAGGALSTNWDNSNRGTYGVSLGYNNTASAQYSIAIGSSNTSSSLSSTAFGSSSVASGLVSTAFTSSDATGTYSFSVGLNTTASNSASTTFGQAFENNQKYSLSVGYGSGSSDTSPTGLIRLEADADQDDTKKSAIYLASTTGATVATNRLENRSGTLYFSGNPYLKNVVEDPSPQLGADLDGQEYAIDNIGDITHDDATASDWIFRNEDLDKNIVFYGNNGGVDTKLIEIVPGATTLFSTGNLVIESGAFVYQKDGSSISARGDVWSPTAQQSAVFRMRKGNGTMASPTAIGTGNRLGAFWFEGYYNTTSTSRSVTIEPFSTEAWSTTNRGAKLEFSTTANGSTSTTVNLTIDEDGGILVPNLLGSSGGSDVRYVSGELIYDTSTARGKLNIDDIYDTSWVHDCLQLREFDRIEGGHDYGVIAEELEQCMPELVNYKIYEYTGTLPEGSVISSEDIIDHTFIDYAGIKGTYLNIDDYFGSNSREVVDAELDYIHCTQVGIGDFINETCETLTESKKIIKLPESVDDTPFPYAALHAIQVLKEERDYYRNPNEISINGGILNVASGYPMMYYSLMAEGGAPDELHTINGCDEEARGVILKLQISDTSEQVSLCDNDDPDSEFDACDVHGNIALAGDSVLKTPDDIINLVCNGVRFVQDTKSLNTSAL